MSAWFVIVLAGLVCYLLRVAPVATDRLRLPDGLDDTFSLVAPAAFSALAATSLATPVLAEPTVAVAVPTLLAATVSVLAVIRTGRPYAAMLAGLPVYWLAALLAA